MFSPDAFELYSFNHIAREVLDVNRSKRFYSDILGFQVVARPPFDCEGFWLYGFGLSLHLVATKVPEERRAIKQSRILHFLKGLPRVDHIAFLTHNLEGVRAKLQRHKVFFRYEEPACTGIKQMFFFDPDGNVIEISNCAPAVNEIRCEMTDEEKTLIMSRGFSGPANLDAYDVDCHDEEFDGSEEAKLVAQSGF